METVTITREYFERMIEAIASLESYIENDSKSERRKNACLTFSNSVMREASCLTTLPATGK